MEHGQQPNLKWIWMDGWILRYFVNNSTILQTLLSGWKCRIFGNDVGHNNITVSQIIKSFTKRHSYGVYGLLQTQTIKWDRKYFPSLDINWSFKQLKNTTIVDTIYEHQHILQLRRLHCVRYCQVCRNLSAVINISIDEKWSALNSSKLPS